MCKTIPKSAVSISDEANTDDLGTAFPTDNTDETDNTDIGKAAGALLPNFIAVFHNIRAIPHILLSVARQFSGCGPSAFRFITFPNRRTSHA